MPLTGERKRQYDKRKAKERRAAHTKAKAAGLPGVPANPNWARPNTIDPTLTDDDLCTPEVLAKVSELAANGVPIPLLCRAIGVTRPRWAKLMERDAFRDAYECGRAAEEMIYAQALRTAAADPTSKSGVTAAIFALKQHGWRDRESSKSGGPLIVVNLPGPASPEQYAQLVSSGALLEAPRED